MLNSDRLKSGLIRHNYFPNQKEGSEELPPIFTTQNLTDELIEDVVNADWSRRSDAYDLIEFRATRFNNVSRPMSIPHPKPYLNLVDKLCEHWGEFNSICSNTNSLVKPKNHEDGRIIIMDYESNYQRTRSKLGQSFGKKFIVHTDIKNFYPSIYSHSIPWALVGMEEAKRNKRDDTKWYNQIDLKTRSIKRGETNGVPIGPATSNIISEILLKGIDEKLNQKYSKHIRYIDDYTSFHDSRESAENFIIDLEKYLSELKLILSLNKTQIVEQPQSLSDKWVSDLTTRMPTDDEIKMSSAIRYLDHANQLRVKYPDGSVLKYAIKSIIDRIAPNARAMVLDYLFNTAIKYPVVIPVMEKLFKLDPSLMTQDRKRKIKVLLREHLKYNRHDVTNWLLFYSIKYRIRLAREIKDDIVNSDDCLSKYLLLLKYPDDRSLIAEITRIISSTDKYLWDNNWLLIYEAFRRGKIENPYQDGVFELLKTDDVKFHHEI